MEQGRIYDEGAKQQAAANYATGGLVGGSTAIDLPAIHGQLQQMDKELEILNSVVSNLRDRLTSVSNEQPPLNVQEKTAEAPYGSEVKLSIVRKIDSIRRERFRIEDLIASLEV